MDRVRPGRRSGPRIVPRIILRGLLLAAVMVIGYFAYTSWQYAKTTAPRYEGAQTGILKHEVHVKATFANEEAVLQAPQAGKLNLLAAEGKRLRKGEEVASVSAAAVMAASGGSLTVTAPIGGLYVSSTDGLETLYTFDHFMSMDLSQVFANPGSAHKVGTEVNYGDPVGKIVNNLTPTAAFVAFPSLKGINLNDTLKFEIDGQTCTAEVLRKTDRPSGVVVRFANFINGSLTERQKEVIWLSAPSTSGVLVPKSALWNKGEERGVLADIDGIISFRRVVVDDENETQACVENLPAGTMVVVNPNPKMEGKLVQ